MTRPGPGRANGACASAICCCLALLGGGVGALLGRWVFRHKTRKAGFLRRLHVAVVAELALLALGFSSVSSHGLRVCRPPRLSGRFNDIAIALSAPAPDRDRPARAP